MRNEELLNEIENLWKTTDREMDELGEKVAKLDGTLAEVIRHNGQKFDQLKQSYESMFKSYDKFVKILSAIIVVLFVALMTILGIKSEIPIPLGMVALCAVKKVKVEKKITNVVPRRLTALETMFEKVENICGLIYLSNPETLILNVDGKNCNQPFMERNLHVLLTHETIHKVLRELGEDQHNGFDHPKKFRNIRRSQFLVDCDWKWLDYKWKWRYGKWIKKTSC